jgi:hypothetical protein
MITVLNMKYENTPAGLFIRVDRGHSPLGNPFIMGKDGSRDEVIEKYRRWLWAEIRKGKAVWAELVRLARIVNSGQGIVLGCWCFPQKCHAQVISKAIVWLIKEGKI